MICAKLGVLCRSINNTGLMMSYVEKCDRYECKRDK